MIETHYLPIFADHISQLAPKGAGVTSWKRQAPSNQPAAPSASANCSRIIETCRAAIGHRATRLGTTLPEVIRHQGRKVALFVDQGFLLGRTAIFGSFFLSGPLALGRLASIQYEGLCGSRARQRSNKFRPITISLKLLASEDDRYNLTELSALPHCAMGVPGSSYTDGACRLLDPEGLTWRPLTAEIASTMSASISPLVGSRS